MKNMLSGVQMSKIVCKRKLLIFFDLRLFVLMCAIGCGVLTVFGRYLSVTDAVFVPTEDRLCCLRLRWVLMQNTVFCNPKGGIPRCKKPHFVL